LLLVVVVAVATHLVLYRLVAEELEDIEPELD
jgi:hypothetical protein